MRIYNAALFAILSLTTGLTEPEWIAPAFAGSATFVEEPSALHMRGEQALVSGDAAGGLALIEAAAASGHVAAQLRIAKLYDTGDGSVVRDRHRSYRMVSAIADAHADADYYHADRRSIAEAFRMLAAYNHSGLPEADLARDPAMAARLRYQSATVFRDPQAQYEIGRMYLDGEGVVANIRVATTFLGYAARSRHSAAQAVYGNLIWQGRGVKRVPAQGLALLALAAAGTDDMHRGWIETLYRAALTAASDADIAEAQAWADANVATYRRDNAGPLRIVRQHVPKVSRPLAQAGENGR